MASQQEMTDRLTRVETRVGLRNNASNLRPFEHEPSIPIVSRAEVLATFPEDGVTTVVVGWETPDNPDFETVEFFVKDLSGNAGGIVKVGESREGPATLVLTADSNSAKTIFLRTKMRNGLGSDLGASPTVTATVNKLSVSGASLEDGSVTTQKVADSAITNAKIGNAAISTAKIQSAAITNALIANLAVDDAKISTLSVAKLTAGTIAVAISITSPTITSSSGTAQISLTSGFLRATNTTNLSRVELTTARVLGYNAGGITETFEISSFGNWLGTQSQAASVILRNSGGTERVVLGTAGATGNGVLRINSQQVVTNRQTGPGTAAGWADATAQTWANNLLAALQAHGLVT